MRNKIAIEEHFAIADSVRESAEYAVPGEGNLLERRLLDAAEALLAHRGTSCTLVPIPGRLPVRCVAMGELAQIREMVRSENVYV